MADSNDKGKLLEDIVAMVHRVHGLAAEPRVFLPALRSPDREREIDVLITASVGPYVVRIPIECKNRGESVSIGEIGDFKDKLDDVGLSPRDAIYVSASGYQSGASERAREHGIMPLTIDGLTEDRLGQEARAALVATLFVFPSVRSMSYQSEHETGGPAFCDDKGAFGGSILDLVWKHWMEMGVPDLGTYAGTETVPRGFGSMDNGSFAQIESVSFELGVEGHLLSQKGTAISAVLREADKRRAVLGHINVEFDTPLGTFELLRLDSESELATVLDHEEVALVSLARVKVPRVMYDGPLGRYPWLPDDSLFEQLMNLYTEDPEAYMSGSQTGRIVLDSDITVLFEAPSATYVDGLRGRLGSTWSPAIWQGIGM